MKRITERASPHVFRVVALPTPEEREKSQMYMQRDVQHFPAAAEVMIFDRTWYNRAGVERVMGFCTEEESKRFLTLVPGVEQAMVNSGIMLIKYWREVSGDEQALSLESRIDDPQKVWKLSELDLISYSRSHDCARARNDMLATTDTRVGAAVQRSCRRQEARPSEHHHAPARPRALRTHPPREGHLARPRRARGLYRGPLGAPLHSHAVLTRIPAAHDPSRLH